MSEQREAIVNLLDPIVGPAYASNAPEAAGAVIQYLWQRADDPEVVEAMYAASLDAVFNNDPSSQQAGRQIVHRAFMAALAHIIGPRPNGEEATDER